MKSSWTKRALLLLLPFATALAPIPTAALACDCDETGMWTGQRTWRVFDGTTLAAWSRTWHGPNALATPLSQYYIPRTPAYCNLEGCDDGSGYSAAGPCQSQGAVGCMYVAEGGVGFEPIQFERLGRIPNDLELSGAPPATSPSR